MNSVLNATSDVFNKRSQLSERRAKIYFVITKNRQSTMACLHFNKPIVVKDVDIWAAILFVDISNGQGIFGPTRTCITMVCLLRKETKNYSSLT